MGSCQRGVDRMSSRGTCFGWSRQWIPLTMFAVFPGLIALVVARTSAADNKAALPGDGAAPRVEVVPDVARQFISEYCTRCHNEDRKVANLDLTSLAYDPADAGNF